MVGEVGRTKWRTTTKREIGRKLVGNECRRMWKGGQSDDYKLTVAVGWLDSVVQCTQSLRRSFVRRSFVHRSSFVVRRSSFVVRRSSFVVRRSFVRSFVIVRRSSFVRLSSFVCRRSSFVRSFVVVRRLSFVRSSSFVCRRLFVCRPSSLATALSAADSRATPLGFCEVNSEVSLSPTLDDCQLKLPTEAAVSSSPHLRKLSDFVDVNEGMRRSGEKPVE